MARLGIDIGGTFTDFALEVTRGQHVRHFFAKVLTTPDAPEQAVLQGVARILKEAGLQEGELDTVIHGTTLATNAVIERRGARIAFITTEGFRDTLEMGNESRYDHYDLNLVKPLPLVPRQLRFTACERMSALGEVLRPLDADELARLVRQVEAADVEAVAIGFLHSYVNPAHEQQMRDALLAHRPDWLVSISSEVAPEIREYERFATVCVNAYVQPVMAGYLRRLEQALQQRGVRAPLMLMLSNGGLCEVELARRFPVRLLESGPAGGAILAAHVARALSIDRALMVDIGGTTAKLCFIDDGIPQTSRAMEVARIDRFKAGSGIPLRFPVVELAEIGAGGGSIAHVDALGRLQVGPESAGSAPGPACYGLGGTEPTVTDAHLQLGRLGSDAFGGGRMPLSSDAARAAYEPLAGSLQLPVDAAAWSVCEVVDENMACAVREHAVDVGKGVDGRTLIAIGGMAPLHAARLASKLGLDRVIIPFGAGVGSALGFLQAPVAFESTRSLVWRAAAFDAARANSVVAPMLEELRAVVHRAAPGRKLDVKRTAWMRYAGQGYEIRVALPDRAFEADDAAGIVRRFEAEYHRLYGRTIANAPVEILGWTVRVEAITPPRQRDAPASPMHRPMSIASPREADTEAMPKRPAYDQGSRRWLDSSVCRVERVSRASSAVGPALLVADETTVVVPSGFDYVATADGDIDMSRRQQPAVGAQGQAIAPGMAPDIPAEIRSQVMWSRLIACVEEQARTLMRTAFSPTVREAGDLSAGLFDAEGRMIAQAVTGTPGHVNSMAECAGHFIGRFPIVSMRPGDHFITNDPWLTSGHLHDITVFSPVFHEGQVVGFFGCTCHQVDIGGLGMGPDARSVYEEGLYLPMLRLARGGAINEDLLDIVRANVRQPDAVFGDILSYVTANEISARSLSRMLGEFGASNLVDISHFVRERSARGMRQAIAALPKGVWRHAVTLDGYDSPVEIDCQLEIADDAIRVHFEGTSPASPQGINLVMNYTKAYAAFGVRAAVAPGVPNNAGSLSLVEVDAPEGSILNVRHPAPVCARHIIGQFLPEIVLGAMAKALPGRLPAEGAACNWGLQLRGLRPAAEGAAPFEILFFNAGGCGARPALDGLSATGFPSGIRAIPVEICETVAPIVIWRKELRTGSGGAGRLRGGLGQRVEVGMRDGSGFQFFGLFDRVRNAAQGRDGGSDGATGWVGLVSGTKLNALGLQAVPAGETLRIDVPGGGGYGPPTERSDELLRSDMALGYVDSPELRPSDRATEHR